MQQFNALLDEYAQALSSQSLRCLRKELESARRLASTEDDPVLILNYRLTLARREIDERS